MVQATHLHLSPVVDIARLSEGNHELSGTSQINHLLIVWEVYKLSFNSLTL